MGIREDIIATTREKTVTKIVGELTIEAIDNLQKRTGRNRRHNQNQPH